MKRLYMLLLCFALLVSFAACSDDQADVQQPEHGSQSQTAPGVEQAGFTLLETDPETRASDLVITAMEMAKEIYTAGEEITVTLNWTGTPDGSAWVGIIPAEISHGDEYVNDDADLDYLYLADHGEGVFSFVTELEPGSYTMRVNETDDGGAELAWCAFQVE